MKHRLQLAVLPAVIFGALTGIVASLMVNLYKVCAKYVIAYSDKGYHLLSKYLYYIPLILLVLGGISLLLAYIYKRVPNLRGGGIPTSIGILRGIIPFKWLRNLVGVFVLSLASFFVGVPLGNEGPSVQMGTAIGRGCVYAFPKKHRAWDRYSMTGGACAGFSVATGAPISGVFFALEEAHQRISPMIVIVASVSVMFATATTEVVAPLLGVDKSLFPAFVLPKLQVKDVWIPIVVGLWIGLFAVLFLKYYRLIFAFFNHTLKKIPHYMRIFMVLAATVVLGLTCHDSISTGHHLILELFESQPAVPLLLLLLVLRATLTLCANSNRITGGIFLPILAVGALAASLLGSLMEMLFGLGEIYGSIILVLGIVSCIAGMMKMPITAIIFALEALSCYDNVLYVIVAAGVSYMITEIFAVESINDRVLDNRVEEINEGKNPKILDKYVTVRDGAFAVGKQVRDIFWPTGLFVLSQTHTKPIDPKNEHAAKALQASDVLHVRCKTFDEGQTKAELEAILGAQDHRL